MLSLIITEEEKIQGEARIQQNDFKKRWIKEAGNQGKIRAREIRLLKLTS